MFKYLLNNIKFNNRKIDLDIYKTDFHGKNILHYAVELKQKETILFLIKYDADYNKLKTTKDIKGKTPIDLDRTKSFENELYTIWDSAKDNNIKILNILLNELKYYDINEQTKFKGNTALHIAVKNRADKVVLFLILNGADKNIKNKEGYTPLEIIKNEKNIDKKWITKVTKIFDGKIKNYIDLDSCNFDKIVKNEENIKFTEKINMINGNIPKIKDTKKEKKEKQEKKGNEIDKLSLGISTNSKLRELLYIISKNIKDKNIDIYKIIQNYDKNNSDVIESDEFDKLFNNLNIENINIEDILFIKSFLDKDENGLIKYKDLIEIINN